MLQQKICRFCLFKESGSADRPLLHIFDTFKKENITDLIKECLNISLTPDDLIPPIICQTCLEKVTYFHDFLELASKSQQQLKLLYGLEQSISSPSNESTDVGHQRTFDWISEERLKTHRTDSDISTSYRTKNVQLKKNFTVQQGKSSVALMMTKDRKPREKSNKKQHFNCVEKRKIQCKICTQTVPINNMGCHLRKHAEKYKSRPTNSFKIPFSCKICRKEFRTENQLKSHMKKTHQPKKIRFSATKGRRANRNCLKISWQTKFKCKICKLQFTTLKALHEHLTEHGKKKKTCPKCKKQFMFKKHFDKHIFQCFYASRQNAPRKTSSLPMI